MSPRTPNSSRQTRHASHRDSTAADILPDIAAWRKQQTERPLHPYEALIGREVASDHNHVNPDKVFQFWLPSGTDPNILVPPVEWDKAFAHDRSLHYHLHSLDPIGLPLAAHSEAPDSRWIDFALPLALDWLGAHPTRDSESIFPWYDMAVGLRAYRLAYLLDVVARDHSHSDDTIRLLLTGIYLHMEVLTDDSEFASHSNHGLYQAAGQLAIVRRFPDFDSDGHHRQQAQGRMVRMLSSQFTEEGVHTEHSPGYHRLMLATFIKLVECGLVNDPASVDRIEDIETALAWFVRPDRKLVTIGDTDLAAMPRDPFGAARSSALRLMVTGGRDGAAPDARVRAFPRSGYVVFRDRWPSSQADFGEGAHLVQQCGFHSRTHKHADDLSFTLFERGQEVLIDPGRFGYRRSGSLSPELAKMGYMYSDPRRIYVESTKAHNTVEIDNASHCRRSPPYGSALDAWGDTNGICWAQSSITLKRHIDHMRLLFFLPGRFLLVIDRLNDRTGGLHHFCQRFHAAPELDIAARPKGMLLRPTGRCAQRLHALTLSESKLSPLTKGQCKPELLGWTSRTAGSFTPSPTFSFEASGVSDACFATLFWWGLDFPANLRAHHSISSTSEFQWRERGAEYSLAFRHDQLAQGIGPSWSVQ